MPKPHKLELKARFEEDVLLAILLSRYDQSKLAELGITPESCVIRGFEVDENRKCTFSICAVTGVDVVDAIAPKVEPPVTFVSEPVMPTQPAPCSAKSGTAPCSSNFVPVRVSRREKNSNE